MRGFWFIVHKDEGKYGRFSNALFLSEEAAQKAAASISPDREAIVVHDDRKVGPPYVRTVADGKVNRTPIDGFPV